MIPKDKHTALRIALIYVVFGAMWILFSDRAMEAIFHSAPALGFAQTVKEWFFIFFTGGMLYLLIERRTRHLVAAARALSESERQFKAIFTRAAVAIAMVDIRGEYIDVNPQWAEMLEYDREELLRMDFARIIHPEDIALSREKIEALARGEIDGYRIEKRFLKKSGATLWVDLSVNVRRTDDGAVEFILGMAVDITQRKAAELALQESQALFDSFMHHLPGLAFMKDTQGRYLFVNEGYRRLFGLDPNARIGKTDEELWPAEVARKLRENDREVWSTGKVLQSREILDFGGKKKAARVTKFPLMKEGRPHILGGISFDITDQVRAEEEKEKLEAQLLQARKMEAIGTLAGGIAHDFNNLLMGILGNASLMHLDLDASHPLHEKLKNIEDYVQSGSELTRQLLGFARSGKYEVRPTDIADLIRRSAALFGRTRKQIHIRDALSPQTWNVAVDRGQIEQVLFNLYVNAWQAMPTGGDLTLGTENVVLDEHPARLLALGAGRYVRITVADTGVGMDEAVRRRIFDPFFTTREMGRGTGMGLASAYGIVQNHGGTIDVTSEKGAGARFFIYLPATDKPAEEDGHPAACGRTREGTGTVYLVDDEAMILEVGEAMLRRLGYAVETFDSGAALLEILTSDPDGADLVILDMVMPDMGGGEVYDAIRRVPSGVKVLLSSGYSIDGQAQAILDRGCDGFIQKPFDLKALSGKICEILEHSDAI